jgi:hypothetical protein
VLPSLHLTGQAQSGMLVSAGMLYQERLGHD